MGLVEACGLVKEYPGVRALGGVSLVFEAGKVHGVIGENGAGKSTLMKVLAGIEGPTSGEVRVDGEAVSFRGVGEAVARGVVLIHQELNLVDDLTVAENVFLGRERRLGLVLDRREMERLSEGFLGEVGARLSSRRRVGSLSVAEKQLVEIAKALSMEARLLIMDEPTAVLSERETEALFSLVHRLKGRGVGVVLISHILDELLAHCDVISVLRDGEHVGTVGSEEVRSGAVGSRELAHLMVGRELGELYPAKSGEVGEVVLRVRGLVVAGFGQGLDLDVRSGEVVGIAGLVGSGRTEFCEAVAGLRRVFGGTVEVVGRSMGRGYGYADVVGAGLAYVSEDRKGAGLHLSLPIGENVAMAGWGDFGGWRLDWPRVWRRAGEWRGRLSIRAGDLGALVGSLSGGNQQKVSLAKWLERGPRVLLLDEPTRGVDIGSKAEIYALIRGLAGEGKGVVMVSSEMPELIGVCDRILVMREGRFVGEVSGAEMTEQRIMVLAAGVLGSAGEVEA